jgi:LysM repeat protein
MVKRFIVISLILLLTLLVTPVSAQTSTPPAGPVYIVQSGDTLWGIALRFNVSVTDLESANNLPDQNIFSWEELVIPGLAGISGTLTTRPVALGETLHSLARQYGVDEGFLRTLNHLLSPEELYAGYNLTLLQKENNPTWTGRTSIGKGGTLLEAAVLQNTDPWTIAGINSLSGTWDSLPGDVFFLPGGSATAPPAGFPLVITSVSADPLPLVQGSTAQVKISSSQAVTLTGTLIDRPLHFFPTSDGSQVALQGIYAMTDPGVYPLRIDATLADGTVQSFEQMVPVSAGQFLSESLEVASETIDPAVTGPEDSWLSSMTAPATPD